MVFHLSFKDVRVAKTRVKQGRSAAGLDWDGLGALGHGVPVLGVDGPMTATSMYDEK